MWTVLSGHYLADGWNPLPISSGFSVELQPGFSQLGGFSFRFERKDDISEALERPVSPSILETAINASGILDGISYFPLSPVSDKPPFSLFAEEPSEAAPQQPEEVDKFSTCAQLGESPDLHDFSPCDSIESEINTLIDDILRDFDPSTDKYSDFIKDTVKRHCPEAASPSPRKKRKPTYAPKPLLPSIPSIPVIDLDASNNREKRAFTITKVSVVSDGHYSYQTLTPVAQFRL